MKDHSDSPETNQTATQAGERAQLPHAEPEIAQLYARVQASLAREHGVRAWLRASPTWLRSSLAAVFSCALVSATALMVPRASDYQPYPALRLLLSSAVYLLALAAILSQLLRPLHRVEVARWRITTLAWLGFAAPFLLALWPAAEPSVARAPRDCMAIGLLVGAALITLLRALDRVYDAQSPSMVSAGAAAGLVGNFALLFHCADTHPGHLFVAHASLGLLSWVGYRMFVLVRGVATRSSVRR